MEVLEYLKDLVEQFQATTRGIKHSPISHRNLSGNTQPHSFDTGHGQIRKLQREILTVIPCASGEAFDDEKQEDYFCTEDTRLELLQGVFDWASTPDAAHGF